MYACWARPADDAWRGCSVWLAHADNSRGFTAKVAGAGCSHPDNLADERHPVRARGTHAPPEVFSEVTALLCMVG